MAENWVIRGHDTASYRTHLWKLFTWSQDFTMSRPGTTWLLMINVLSSVFKGLMLQRVVFCVVFLFCFGFFNMLVSKRLWGLNNSSVPFFSLSFVVFCFPSSPFMDSSLFSPRGILPVSCVTCAWTWFQNNKQQTWEGQTWIISFPVYLWKERDCICTWWFFLETELYLLPQGSNCSFSFRKSENNLTFPLHSSIHSDLCSPVLLYNSPLYSLPPPSFNLEQWMGRSVSGLASLSFSHAFAPELLGCETNLPTIGLLPLSVQFNRCWHVGGYPWVCKIRFPCLLLTPHWSHSLCVHLGMKVQLSVVLCLYCPALQFLCTYSLSAVFEMLTLYELKRKC